MPRQLQVLTMMSAALIAFSTTSCSSDDSGGTATSTSTPVALPSDFADRTDVIRYYTDLGVTPKVAECFADVLVDLGVEDPAALEADQELSETAASRFELCTSSDGALSTES